MSKFRKGGKKPMTAISTASLPDIVFMLLFFFMVTTVMRETELKVEVTTPNATEVVKLKKKSELSYIYIGSPNNKAAYGNATRIQLNDRIATPDDIQEFIEKERKAKDARDRKKMRVQLKADQAAEMGIITDVKQELRKADALKINYATFEERE